MTEPRGRGRPATGRDPVWTVRLPRELWAEAHEAAKANGDKFGVFVERAFRAEIKRIVRRTKRPPAAD